MTVAKRLKIQYHTAKVKDSQSQTCRKEPHNENQRYDSSVH